MAENGEVKVKEALDREVTPVHYLTFTATDRDSRSTTVPGTITVDDVNDNEPK